MLLHYVAKGDFNKARDLIDGGKSIWVMDEYGRNVLQVAAKECHFNIVKYIVENRRQELTVKVIKGAIKEAKAAKKRLILEISDLMKEIDLTEPGHMEMLDEKADIKNAKLQDCLKIIDYLKKVKREKKSKRRKTKKSIF